MNSDISTKEYEDSKKTTITPGREDSLGSREHSGKLNGESKREKKLLKAISKEDLLSHDQDLSKKIYKINLNKLNIQRVHSDPTLHLP
jgi:hypothetical protein